MSHGKVGGWIRRPPVTLALVALILAILVADTPLHFNHQNDHPASNYGDNGGTNNQDVTFGWRLRQAFDAFLGDAAEAQATDGDCDRKCQRDKKDLEAQMDMALWAQAMFWAAFVTAIVTGVGVYFVAKTLRATATAATATLKAAEAAIAANKIQHDMLHASNWAQIEPINKAAASGNMAIIRNDVAFCFEIELENSGPGPATNCYVIGEYFDGKQDTLLEKTGRMCVECKKNGKKSGKNIKPTGSSKFSIFIEIDKDIFFNIFSKKRGMLDAPAAIFIALCVYHDSISDNVGKYYFFSYACFPKGIGKTVTSADLPISKDHISIIRISTDSRIDPKDISAT